MEHYLEGAGECAMLLLCELLHVELAYRRRAGEIPTLDEYRLRFPTDGAALAGVFREMGLASTLELAVPPVTAGPAGPQVRTLPAQGSPPASVADSGLAPEKIGRYPVLRKLGQGGFGTVYLARDEALGRQVAIKTPRAERFVTEESVQRFLDEARLAAGLKHPAIVTVHDVGRQPDGTCYVVLEFMAGGSLEGLLKTGPLPPERAVGLMAQIAEAVHYAHKQGLVHRDLKPANVLLDEGGVPHVADFGLALHEATQRSRAGELAGTPAYMAPEQVRGEAHYLDGRTDVWALGVMLYEMLTGRRPFAGNRRELHDEILHRDPKPARQIDDAIPEALDRICRKCLSKELTGRYPTAADLAADLRRWQRPKSRLPHSWLTALVLLILTVGSGVYFLSSTGRPAATPAGAALPQPAPGPAAPPASPPASLAAPVLDSLTFLIRRNDNDDEIEPFRLMVNGAEQNVEAIAPLGPKDSFKLKGRFAQPANWYLLWFDTAKQVDVVLHPPVPQAGLEYPADDGRYMKVANTDPPGQQLLLLVAGPQRPEEGKGQLLARLAEVGRPPDVPAARWSWLHRGAGQPVEVLPKLAKYRKDIRERLPPGLDPVHELFLRTVK
jgi:serine/threonine protein kinase